MKLAGLYFLLGTLEAFAGPIQLIVLTGQSNSLGTTADPAEKNPGPGWQPEDEKARLFWSNCSSQGRGKVCTVIGDSGGTFKTLQSQQGEGRNRVFWGPEMALGRELVVSGKTDFVIVKASRGGGGNSHWLPDGSMYPHILDTVHAAVRVLEGEEHDVLVSHLLYIQGESDSAVEAAVAGERIAALLDNLRRDLPRAGKMDLIIGGIAARGGYRDQVRAQQAAIANKREDIIYIDNLDLRGHLYDGLHFDKAAKVEIGRRFARILIDGE